MACIKELEASEKGKKFLASKYVNATELTQLVNINDVYGIGHLVDLNAIYENLDHTKQGYFLLDIGGFLLISEEQIDDLLTELVDESVRIDMELAKVMPLELKRGSRGRVVFQGFQKRVTNEFDS